MQVNNTSALNSGPSSVSCPFLSVQASTLGPRCQLLPGGGKGRDERSCGWGLQVPTGTSSQPWHLWGGGRQAGSSGRTLGTTNVGHAVGWGCHCPLSIRAGRNHSQLLWAPTTLPPTAKPPSSGDLGAVTLVMVPLQRQQPGPAAGPWNAAAWPW